MHSQKRDRENRSVFQSEMTRARTRDSLRVAIKYTENNE